MRAVWRIGVLVALAACGRIGFDGAVTPDVSAQARASFAVGDQFACAIRSGDVYCWGEREYGQDGDGGSVSPALVPRRVPGIPKAAQLDAAHYHACIVSVDGAVWCWGGDERGRLGNVPGGSPATPAVVPLPERAIEVSVAPDNSCAVLESGAVWCWGINLHGQLGRGFASESLDGFAPAEVPGLTDVTRISLDEDSACAVRRDGSVWCWGDNNRKMIDGTATDVVAPVAVAGFTGATAVAVGGDHVCAVMAGRVGCRGEGTGGQLGDGRSEDSVTVVFSTLDDYVSLASATTHTCAVRETGAVMCWGQNPYGVLGDGTLDARALPTEVDDLDDAIAIATGVSSTCAMRADGRITCWGSGPRGLLGDGRSPVLSAQNVPGLSLLTSITAGLNFTCASTGQAVWCWGANSDGQLGADPSVAIPTPQAIPFTWPARVTQLVAGAAHACALLQNDEVYCWGGNYAGQLGDGTDQHRTTPARVPLPATTRIAGGLFHTCALGADTNVRCWGGNPDGQLGDQSTTHRTSPVVVALGVAELGAGDAHTCVRIGAQVSCWGNNHYGQLGDGTETTRPSAVAISGLDAANISIGGHTSCARRDGNILCWGLNADDLLGIPNAGYFQSSPALSSRTALFTMGGSTGCAGASCWGTNRYGQVGAGAFGYFSEPTQVEGLPDSAATQSLFAVGATHACVIVIDVGRTVWCWGENRYGEIGVGTVTEVHAPATTVAFP